MEYRIWNDVDKKMENKMINDKYIAPSTDLCDGNGKKIYLGDIVEINDVLYKIVFERGAYSLCTVNWSYTINYDAFEALKQEVLDDSSLSWNGSRNDYIMPLWDLFENLEYTEDVIQCLNVVGNVKENKELLNFSI